MLEGTILSLMYVLGFGLGIFVLCGLGALIVCLVQHCRRKRNNQLRTNLLENTDSVV